MLEEQLRFAAKNWAGPAREILADFLMEHGREGEMPSLLNSDFRLCLYSSPQETHMFPIRLWNGWTLSVQASEMHYSSPRKNNLGIYNYTAFEVAIWYKGREYVNPTKFVPVYKRYWDGFGVSCGVPVADVQQLFLTLMELTH